MSKLKERILKDNIRYGKKLKKRLIDLGMANKELAERLGIDPRYISKIICGDRSGRKYRGKIEKILNEKEKEIA